MKVAFTATGTNLDSPMDSRFGRSRAYIVVDLETNAFQTYDNSKSMNAAQGAGVQAAEAVARLGVQALVSGHCGPKAFHVLQAAGITVYTTSELTVAAALAAYKAGKLKPITVADVQGHWA